MLGDLGYYGEFYQHQNPHDTKIFFQMFSNRIHDFDKFTEASDLRKFGKDFSSLNKIRS